MLRKLRLWAPKPRLLDSFISRYLDNKPCILFKLRPDIPAKMHTLPSPLPPGGMVLHSIWCKTVTLRRADLRWEEASFFRGLNSLGLASCGPYGIEPNTSIALWNDKRTHRKMESYAFEKQRRSSGILRENNAHFVAIDFWIA